MKDAKPAKKEKSVNKEKEEKETKKGTNGCIVLKRTLFLSVGNRCIFLGVKTKMYIV